MKTLLRTIFVVLIALNAVAIFAQEASLKVLNDNISELYRQRQYSEAVNLAWDGLRLAEETFGYDHPNVAVFLEKLGSLYQVQGKHHEAESFFERARVIVKKALGNEHSSLAAIMNSMGLLYRDMGRHSEAYSFIKQSLEILEKVRGEDHPDVATSLENLASVCQKQNKSTEAELFYKRALVIKEKSLGKDHYGLSKILTNMGMLYHSQGRYDEARDLFGRTLKIFEKALGENHVEVVALRDRLEKTKAAQKNESLNEVLSYGFLVFLILLPCVGFGYEVYKKHQRGTVTEDADRGIVWLFVSMEGRIGQLRYFIGGTTIFAAYILARLCVAILISMVYNGKGRGLEMGLGIELMFLVILGLVMVWPSIAVGAKRCHDLGRSAHLLWLGLVPIANLALGLYLLVAPGSPRPNRYGPPFQCPSA